jgi:hypothetical protein
LIGFKLDPTTNDITSVGGKISLLRTVQEAVRQRLSIKLRTFAGEWFLDTTYGIPYRQQILGKGLSVAERDALFIKEINADPDVNSIVYFSSNFDRSVRDYSLKFEVKVDDALLRPESASLTPAEEIDYGDGINSSLQPVCSNQYFQYSLDLHIILHEYLPAGGRSTWIYP